MLFQRLRRPHDEQVRRSQLKYCRSNTDDHVDDDGPAANREAEKIEVVSQPNTILKLVLLNDEVLGGIVSACPLFLLFFLLLGVFLVLAGVISLLNLILELLLISAILLRQGIVVGVEDVFDVVTS